MATKNILFFMKIPEKGKKLSTPRMEKRILKIYHRDSPLSMSFLEQPLRYTTLLTIIYFKIIHLQDLCQNSNYLRRFSALFFKEL